MKNFYKSLAAFQQEVGSVDKNSKGYNYNYADLPNIITTINPILAKHNLGFTQPIKDGVITTIVFHTDSGESLESSRTIPEGVELKGQNYFQVLGSSITYLRRYALGSILGIVTDEDNDAQGEQTKAPTKTKSSYVKKDDNINWMTEDIKNKILGFVKNDLERAKKNFNIYAESKTIDGVTYKMKNDYKNAIKEALDNAEYNIDNLPTFEIE